METLWRLTDGGRLPEPFALAARFEAGLATQRTFAAPPYVTSTRSGRYERRSEHVAKARASFDEVALQPDLSFLRTSPPHLSLKKTPKENMMTHSRWTHVALAVVLMAGFHALADAPVADTVIEAQRAALATATEGRGFGPQSPRDVNDPRGENQRLFAHAPAYDAMNLCNIHFHSGAEHKGGDFTTYLGNGDGEGYETGFGYDGTLTEAELAPLGREVGNVGHGGLEPGDTIEAHFVFSTADVGPAPTLGACLDGVIANPQLRVEAQVYVLVNDPNALDFGYLAAHDVVNGLHQAIHLPTNLGTPIEYAGSTTGPSYNEAGSPMQATWSVHPRVAKVDIASVEAWFADNVFDEDHAHGVRNLVTNPALLSEIR